MLLFFPIDATIYLILSLVVLYIQKIQLILLQIRVDIAWYLLQKSWWYYDTLENSWYYFIYFLFQIGNVDATFLSSWRYNLFDTNIGCTLHSKRQLILLQIRVDIAWYLLPKSWCYYNPIKRSWCYWSYSVDTTGVDATTRPRCHGVQMAASVF